MSSAYKPCLWEADGPRVLPGTWKLPAGPEERGAGACLLSFLLPRAVLSLRCAPLHRLPLAGQVTGAAPVAVSVCVEKGIYLSSRRNALVRKGASALVWRRRFRCFETFLCRAASRAAA